MSSHTMSMQKLLARRGVYTLKELGGCVGRTAAERVQLAANRELVAEAEVGQLDVLIAVHQQVFCLQTRTRSAGCHVHLSEFSS